MKFFKFASLPLSLPLPVSSFISTGGFTFADGITIGPNFSSLKPFVEPLSSALEAKALVDS